MLSSCPAFFKMQHEYFILYTTCTSYHKFDTTTISFCLFLSLSFSASLKSAASLSRKGSMVHIRSAVYFVFSSLAHSVCVQYFEWRSVLSHDGPPYLFATVCPAHTHCLLPWPSFAYRQRSHLWRAVCSLKFSPEAPDRMAVDNLFIQEKKIKNGCNRVGRKCSIHCLELWGLLAGGGAGDMSRLSLASQRLRPLASPVAWPSSIRRTRK